MQAASRIAQQPGARSHADVFGAEVRGASHTQQADARNHLEASMAAALILGEPQEYKRWLVMYVKHLVVYCDQVGDWVRGEAWRLVLYP